ncbi:hypothetical protein Lesp02_83900 [Lentzea sp. NBRC 105346]|uniref:MmpS family transport accessory protein n=1 Tax=Lentzea sp. NBRC 105346 TaxID=3032205 RepID=UPI00249F95BB|nr:MmpS family transport accessory protein [Lentzea sp. NBRC 105346]GLZ36203.1 hypothetical protein Lesp02_83900 [Lentzea sp. NBRC 105346]
MSQPQSPGHQPYPPQPQYAPQQPPAGYAPLPPPVKKRKTWLWVLGAIVALIVIAGIANGGKSPSDRTAAAGQATTSAQAAQPTAAKEPAKPATRKVVYEVTGAGQALSITYITDGKASQQQAGNVKLPWHQELELPAGEAFQMVSLVVQAGDGTPEISAKVTVDGKLVKEGKSSGQYAVLTLSENIGSFK